jgi:hypothetical protein
VGDQLGVGVMRRFKLLEKKGTQCGTRTPTKSALTLAWVSVFAPVAVAVAPLAGCPVGACCFSLSLTSPAPPPPSSFKSYISLFSLPDSTTRSKWCVSVSCPFSKRGITSTASRERGAGSALSRLSTRIQLLVWSVVGRHGCLGSMSMDTDTERCR